MPSPEPQARARPIPNASCPALCLMLDAVGIEVVFGAWNPPAAPVAIGGHDHRMGAGEGVMLALVGTLTAIGPST